MTLVVGDFVYEDILDDPLRVTGAASGITTLNGQRSILEFARETGHQVWFDVHVWTGGPRPSPSFDAMFSYIDALEKLDTGYRCRFPSRRFRIQRQQSCSAAGTCQRPGYQRHRAGWPNTGCPVRELPAARRTE